MDNKAGCVIVASTDAKVTRIFSNILALKNYSILIAKEKLTVIWDALDSDVKCLVIDLESFFDEERVFINIIKKIRPRLPIVTIHAENREISDCQLETGIFYRALKPLRVQEIEHVVQAIDRKLLREQDCMSASL